MEYEKIKELIECMGNSALTSLDIEFPDGIKLNMKKDATTNIKVVEKNEVNNVITSIDTIQEINEKIEGNIVKSPMVGTFYLKPAPDASPFVSNGQMINKGNTLCIIEAMKLMNEIESEFDGKIVDIFVKDGEAVEYGRPLFRIV